ncbi:hypothetical protein CR513_55492, partial [Mucuna pruriens]
MEAVLAIEVEIPSLRVLAEIELEEVEWIQQRLDQLNLIEEKRLAALCHGQLYQRRIKNTFDKKARPRMFKKGDMVLKKILPNVKDQRGKLTPNYEGPYVVKHTFSGGALILTDAEGQDLKHSVNVDSVKIRKAREVMHQETVINPPSLALGQGTNPIHEIALNPSGTHL